MLPSSLAQTTIDYLGQLLPEPTVPPNLAVDAGVWKDLANVLLASRTVDYVTGMRIIKLNENWVGLLADLNLTHGIARPELLTGNIQRYYVAHNTDWNAAAHILHQGIWRPSSYEPRLETSHGRRPPPFTQEGTCMPRRLLCFTRQYTNPLIGHVVYWADPSFVNTRMSNQNLVVFLRISLPPCIMTLREQRMEDGRFVLAHPIRLGLQCGSIRISQRRHMDELDHST